MSNTDLSTSFLNVEIADFSCHRGMLPAVHELTDIFDKDSIINSLQQGKIIYANSMSFKEASNLFSTIVDYFNLRTSYDIQMQLVPRLMSSRETVDDVAVTVSERGDYKIIQPHSEGNTSSPLEIFGIYCNQNCVQGGENIFSLVNQHATYSNLKAKVKAVVGNNIGPKDLHKLRINHRDAHDVLNQFPSHYKLLHQDSIGSVVVCQKPVTKQFSKISGKEVLTLWDNITVHDNAFHEYHYELLKRLNILDFSMGEGFEHYRHVGEYSDWGPADTHSGSVEETSKLFSFHIVYKMQSGDFLFFDNRLWAHSVNNWHPSQMRKMYAMYA